MRSFLLSCPQTTLNPVQNGIEMVMDNVEQLKTVIQRIRNDSTHSTNPLTMKLNGSLDAAVNGGVSMFEVPSLSPSLISLTIADLSHHR